MLRILFLILFVPFVANAAPTIGLEVISVRGENAMSLPQSIRLTNKLVARFRSELNVRFRVLRFKRRNNAFLDSNNIERYIENYRWYSYAQASCDRRAVKLVLLPPLTSGNGAWYFGGGAQSQCAPGGAAWASASMRRFNGAPAFVLSLMGAMHEVGHLLGADHDGLNDVSVMNPWLGPIVEKYGVVRFSKNSRFEMQNCLNLF